MRVQDRPIRIGSILLTGLVLVSALLIMASPAQGNINLEWRPDQQVVQVGQTVKIGLYAVSDSQEDQYLGALDVIITWEPEYMRLLGVDDTGGPDWALSGFILDPYWLNEVIPPADGDGLYTAWGRVGVPVVAAPEGSLMTTFRFEALRETPLTELRIPEQMRIPPSPTAHTKVYDWEIPNKNVTGTLGFATVTIGEPRCTGNEKIKAKCKSKAGKNLLSVKLLGGVAGDTFEVELASGEKKDGELNSKGKAKAKFKKQPSGPGSATARWGCGAEAMKDYSCP